MTRTLNTLAGLPMKRREAGARAVIAQARVRHRRGKLMTPSGARFAGPGRVCEDAGEAQQPADRHGRRPGHSERGDAAALDGDLPRAVERSTGRDLVAREAAQSAARRYPLSARCAVGLGLCGGFRPLRNLGQRPGERHRRGRRRRADRRDRVFLGRSAHRDDHRGARFDRARARSRLVRRRRARSAGDLSDAAARARPQARRQQRTRRPASRAAPPRAPSR